MKQELLEVLADPRIVREIQGMVSIDKVSALPTPQKLETQYTVSIHVQNTSEKVIIPGSNDD